MSQVVAGGVATAVPGVYGKPRYAAGQKRQTPEGKVLSLVGNFPFLENGKFARFSSPAAMVRAVPGDATVELIANVIFNASADDRARGAPAAIELASLNASTQAFNLLQDLFGVNSVKLSSRLFGVRGSQTALQLSPNSVDPLLRDLLVGRAGTTEPLLALGSGPVLNVKYTAGPVVTKALIGVRAPLLDTDADEAVGIVDVIARVPALSGTAGVTNLAADEGTCAGKVTIVPSEAPSGDITITVTGINQATGLTDTDAVVMPSGATVPVLGAVAFSRITGFTVGTTDSATYEILFPIKTLTVNEAPTVASVAAALNDVPRITALIKHAQVTTMPIGALDPMSLSDFTAGSKDIRADAWAFADAVNNLCILAGAEQVKPASAPVITQQGGSSGVATLAADSASGSSFTSTTGLVPGDTLLFGVDADNPVAALRVLSVDSSSAVTFDSASPIDWPGGPVWLLRPTLPSRPASFSGGSAVVSGTTNASDTFTIGVGHPFVDGDGVTLTADDGATLPTGFAEDVTYYIGDASPGSATVKLYDAPGGSLIALSDDLTGTAVMTRVVQTRYMAGGTDGLETTASRDAALQALRFAEAAVLVPLTTAAATVAATLQHSVYMAGPGQRECNVWAGAPRNSTLDALKALAVSYNTRHLSLCAQEIRVVNPQGRRVWLGPEWQALQCAALQCAVNIGVPITFKRPNAIDVRSPVTWDGTLNANELILSGITTYMRDNIGLKVARAVTTHLSDQNIAATEVSANESVYWSIRDLRDYIASVVGTDSANVNTKSLKNIAIPQLRKQKADKRITDFTEAGVDIERYNDVSRITYPVMPVVPNNFVFIEPVVEAVTFELVLS